MCRHIFRISAGQVRTTYIATCVYFKFTYVYTQHVQSVQVFTHNMCRLYKCLHTACAVCTSVYTLHVQYVQVFTHRMCSLYKCLHTACAVCTSVYTLQSDSKCTNNYTLIVQSV